MRERGNIPADVLPPFSKQIRHPLVAFHLLPAVLPQRDRAPIDWKTGYYHHLRLIAQERDFYRKSIQYSINTPFGQTVMPENRKTVLLETLEKYRHVTVNDNMRFIVEIFSKLECEVLNDWFRSDAPTDLVRWTDDLVSLVPDRLYRALRIDEPGGTSAG